MKKDDLLKSFSYRQVYPGIFIYIYINPKGKQYVCCTGDSTLYNYFEYYEMGGTLRTRTINSIRKFIVSHSSTSLKDFIELFDKLEK